MRSSMVVMGAAFFLGYVRDWFTHPMLVPCHYSLWFAQLVQLEPGVVAMYGVMGSSVGIPHSMTVVLV